MFFFNFRDLKQTDEGFYECQVNASPLLRHRIHLNVVGKLKIDKKKNKARLVPIYIFKKYVFKTQYYHVWVHVRR